MNAHRNSELGPTELIGGVIDDARELASAEIDKLKAEIKQVGETAKIIGIALAILILAGVMVGTAISFALISAGLPAWAAFGSVGAVATFAGVMVIKYPRKIANAR
jgi:Putative Actinobacterial Holin-X, holin superfamily III